MRCGFTQVCIIQENNDTSLNNNAHNHINEEIQLVAIV